MSVIVNAEKAIQQKNEKNDQQKKEKTAKRGEKQ